MTYTVTAVQLGDAGVVVAQLCERLAAQLVALSTSDQPPDLVVLPLVVPVQPTAGLAEVLTRRGRPPAVCTTFTFKISLVIVKYIRKNNIQSTPDYME